MTLSNDLQRSRITRSLADVTHCHLSKNDFIKNFCSSSLDVSRDIFVEKILDPENG